MLQISLTSCYTAGSLAASAACTRGTRDKTFTAEMSQVLDIERCDLNFNSNSNSHHTELYGEERLIVRRGQPFEIILHLSSGSSDKVDESSFTFIVETGPLPRKESDTKVSFSPQSSTVDTEWSASVTNVFPGHTITVSISSSPNAPIGVYSLTLDQQGQKTSLGQFILLFNAWCSKDAVYMRSKEKRQEYVLAQQGQIYKGSSKRIKGKPWNFGQFSSGILDICFKILDDNPKFVSDADADVSGRRNPIYVTRVLSAMINDCNDRGVLVGNWSGDFSDGAHPGTWLGSANILRQWAESGPVRYGQCWVFAAVACTVSRALGIPCRVVTNFGSAHDTDANLVIEKLYDENGERLHSGDSVWNFHVWVDSWMTRPDLGDEYDGWQTSDPTPQETSDGVFCCGPASVKAIREGELTLKYDAPFIFAEVNADVAELVRLSNGEFVQFDGSTKSVGCFISTKAVGLNERHDITHQYKYREGSEEERRVYEKAKHHNKLEKRGEKPGLHLKIKLAENMIVGSTFEVFAVLTNNCMDVRSCTFLFFATAVGYNGKLGDRCGFSSDRVEVPSGEERRLSLQLDYDSYGPVITSDGLIQLSAISIDKQTIEYCKVEKTIVLDEPDIEIKLEGEAAVNQPMTVELTMLNSLPEPLQDCSFTIEVTDVTDGKPITEKVGTVGAKEEVKASITFIPTTAGPGALFVNFDSDKLNNIKSFMDFIVKQ
ncbi:protein-glutamine gamma-glutamyltransferase 2-like [Cololabis saira]|uniref:protein-glutamine gamma-glutamyltransferase 2-like n=1 Tax=Cololabis saira TaxID=129043 RepID=UPI002AD32107|nr:protein-glutamine gamma-glutamyltransferase 2-like [Cololabis saira]